MCVRQYKLTRTKFRKQELCGHSAATDVCTPTKREVYCIRILKEQVARLAALAVAREARVLRLRTRHAVREARTRDLNAVRVQSVRHTAAQNGRRRVGRHDYREAPRCIRNVQLVLNPTRLAKAAEEKEELDVCKQVKTI